MKAAKYLHDIRQYASDVTEFLIGKERDDYLNDKLLRFAVERGLQVAGEAAYQLQRQHPAVAERLPAIYSLVKFRHVLVHGYDKLKHEEVWDNVHAKLPELMATADALLREVDPDAPPE